MLDYKKIIEVLTQHLSSASSSFSIGAFGAIAEFHRDLNENLLIDKTSQLTLMTSRGAIKIEIPENTQPVAYETLSKNKHHWQQGVAFCLPRSMANMNQRQGLTELGKDQGSMVKTDQNAILFDMGIDAYNIDFCIRTHDTKLIKLLRQSEGQSFSELNNEVKNQLIEDSPTRVIVSRLGRIEIYQYIGKDKTPQGPHTHLLSKLLAKKATHSANTPIPDNLVPCLTLHPANPLLDQLGQSIPFDLSRFKQFEALFEQWGAEECKKQKKSLTQAVLSGCEPSAYTKPDTREARAALRIALRQMYAQDQNQPEINSWYQYFEN